MKTNPVSSEPFSSPEHSTGEKQDPYADRARDFRVGSVVRIRSANEVLATLDPDGRTDGLPWMPQMTSFCGRQVRLVRWVTSSCTPTCDGVVFGRIDNAVILDVDRCDGSDYGGCQMNCRLIWKLDWLTTDLDTSTAATDDQAMAALRDLARLNATVADRSQCQATQLASIMDRHAGSAWQQYRREVGQNRVSVAAVPCAFALGQGHLHLACRQRFYLTPSDFVLRFRFL